MRGRWRSARDTETFLYEIVFILFFYICAVNQYFWVQRSSPSSSSDSISSIVITGVCCCCCLVGSAGLAGSGSFAFACFSGPVVAFSGSGGGQYPFSFICRSLNTSLHARSHVARKLSATPSKSYLPDPIAWVKAHCKFSFTASYTCSSRCSDHSLTLSFSLSFSLFFSFVVLSPFFEHSAPLLLPLSLPPRSPSSSSSSSSVVDIFS
mmetsp:Transcript_5216/g.15666  ORF Transcript_5216/g.15666 Transcript_5216/m.15666 type:complete len:208 (-) Transcript_5216:2803-3426(-)